MKNKLTAKRLQLALSDTGMSQQELAEKSGVSKASISQYVNGSHAPSNISSGKIGKVLNVEPMWLMGFDVPMKRNSNKIPEKSQPEILQYYNLLNDLGKHEATKRVKELTELQRYIKDDRLINAAHADGYIDASEELRQLEENIMDDENF